MSKRTPLRVIAVDAPAWSDAPVTMREPSIALWRSVSKIEDDGDRTLALLADMVLDDEGKPVGREQIDEAPLAALAQLAKHIPALLGEGESASPLNPTTSSTTDSPSLSEG